MARNKDYGYKAPDLASVDLTNLRSVFKNAGAGTQNAFQVSPGSAPDLHANVDPNAKIELTDISNVKFDKIPVIERKAFNVNEAAVEPQDPTQMKETVENTKANYLEVDKQAKDAIRDTVDPADRGVFDSISSPGNSSSGLAGIAAGALAGPVGGAAVAAAATMAGNAYTLMAAAARESNSSKRNEVFEKALHTLHEGCDQQTMAFQNGHQPALPKFNFKAFKTGKQLEDFCARDPLEDEMGKKIKDAQNTLKGLDAQKKLYDNHYTDNVTGDKLAAARDAGNEGMVKKLAGGEAEAEAVMAGARLDAGTVGLEGGSVADIQANPELLMELKKANKEPEVFKVVQSAAMDSTASNKAVMAALGMEPDLAKLGLQKTFQMSSPSSAA